MVVMIILGYNLFKFILLNESYLINIIMIRNKGINTKFSNLTFNVNENINENNTQSESFDSFIAIIKIRIEIIIKNEEVGSEKPVAL